MRLTSFDTSENPIPLGRFAPVTAESESISLRSSEPIRARVRRRRDDSPRYALRVSDMSQNGSDDCESKVCAGCPGPARRVLGRTSTSGRRGRVASKNGAVNIPQHASV